MEVLLWCGSNASHAVEPETEGLPHVSVGAFLFLYKQFSQSYILQVHFPNRNNRQDIKPHC